VFGVPWFRYGRKRQMSEAAIAILGFSVCHAYRPPDCFEQLAIFQMTDYG
jgi:hypothetical protein